MLSFVVCCYFMCFVCLLMFVVAYSSLVCVDVLRRVGMPLWVCIDLRCCSLLGVVVRCCLFVVVCCCLVLFVVVGVVWYVGVLVSVWLFLLVVLCFFPLFVLVVWSCLGAVWCYVVLLVGHVLSIDVR